MLRYIIKLVLCSLLIISVYATFLKAEDDEVVENNYHHFTLSNGLEFYLIQTNSPVVTYITWYDVGGGNDINSKEGVAHFVEHLMFKGTNKYSGTDFSKTIQLAGGNFNAFTSQDYTVYHETFQADYLSNIMSLESDRMHLLKFNSNDFDSEKKVILEERNMRVDNDVIGGFFEEFNSYFFAGSQYGHSLIGTREYFNKVDLNDVKSFYENYYYPNNTKIFVIGNVNINNLKLLAYRYYSYIPKKIVENKLSFMNKEPIQGIITYSLKDTRVKQELLVRSYIAPTFNTIEKDQKSEIYGLILASKILGSDSGILYQELVKNKQLATDVSVSYDENAKANTSFDIIIVPRDGVSLTVLNKELDNIIKQLIATGIKNSEIRIKAKKIRDDIVFLQDKDESYLLYFAYNIMSGLTIKEVLSLPKDLFFTSQKDVNKALVSVFSKGHAVGKLLKD
jgi:zinc protease